MPESLLPLAHAQWGKQRRRRRRCCPSVGTKKKKSQLSRSSSVLSVLNTV